MEEVTVSGGRGVVDVRGRVTGAGGVESVLWLDGAAAILDCSTGEGERLVARAPEPAARPEVPYRLGLALTTGQIRRPLADTLRPLVMVLANGRYELHGPEPMCPTPREWAVATPEPDKPWRFSVSLLDDADGYVVPVDSWPPADEARVGYYRTAIRSGYRPMAVLLHLAGTPRLSGFILDGHHKIAAYHAESVTPQVIRISRRDAPTLDATSLDAAALPDTFGTHDFLAPLES